MKVHESINYLEFPARDIKKNQQFFAQVFGWEFTGFGPEYSAFTGAGIDGGFYQAELNSSTENGGALVVFYSETLEQTQQKIVEAGGKIVKPVFDFPGGRRFHFSDPNGNEFAVWSDNAAA